MRRLVDLGRGQRVADPLSMSSIKAVAPHAVQRSADII